MSWKERKKTYSHFTLTSNIIKQRKERIYFMSSQPWQLYYEISTENTITHLIDKPHFDVNMHPDNTVYIYTHKTAVLSHLLLLLGKHLPYLSKCAIQNLNSTSQAHTHTQHWPFQNHKWLHEHIPEGTGSRRDALQSTGPSSQRAAPQSSSHIQLTDPVPHTPILAKPTPSYGPFPGGEGANKFKMNKSLHTITSLSVATGWQAHKTKTNEHRTEHSWSFTVSAPSMKWTKPNY